MSSAMFVEPVDNSQPQKPKVLIELQPQKPKNKKL